MPFGQSSTQGACRNDRIILTWKKRPLNGEVQGRLATILDVFTSRKLLPGAKEASEPGCPGISLAPPEGSDGRRTEAPHGGDHGPIESALRRRDGGPGRRRRGRHLVFPVRPCGGHAVSDSRPARRGPLRGIA